MRAALAFAAFVLLVSCVPPARAETVRLFTWWDYLAPEVLARLKAGGFTVNITEYRSNDVAVARLGNNAAAFDVAIVSNAVIGPLSAARLFDEHSLRPLLKERRYEPFLVSPSRACVPYMWSTTLFAYDNREPITPPSSIGSLVELKKSGFGVYIIDDSLEYLARVIADRTSVCGKPIDFGKTVFANIAECRSYQDLPSFPELRAENFVSSIGEKLAGAKSAIYGWSGEVALAQAANPWIEYALPKANPIIGVDLVCLVSRRKSRVSLERLRRFVTILTDKESTRLNIVRNQYFSPYSGDVSGLLPRPRKLRERLNEVFKATPPIFFAAPVVESQAKINRWWRKTRYAQ